MQDRAMPEIDTKRCTHCGACVEACPAGAVGLTEAGPVFVKPEACTYCGLCEDVCLSRAVTLYYAIVWEPPASTAGESESRWAS